MRAAVGQYVIEYFQFDFELGLNDPPLNGTVEGTFYGSNMTFAFVLTLTCLGNFYGPNCSVYCKPENSSKGHYRCLDDGSKECLTGYKNVSNNCVTCVPAEGCRKSNTFKIYSSLSLWLSVSLSPSEWLL